MHYQLHISVLLVGRTKKMNLIFLGIFIWPDKENEFDFMLAEQSSDIFMIYIFDVTKNKTKTTKTYGDNQTYKNSIYTLIFV